MRRFKSLLYLLSLPSGTAAIEDYSVLASGDAPLSPALSEYLIKLESSSPASISAARLKAGMVDTIGVLSSLHTSLFVYI